MWYEADVASSGNSLTHLPRCTKGDGVVELCLLYPRDPLVIHILLPALVSPALEIRLGILYRHRHLM